MTSSFKRVAVTLARDVDDMIAAEWALEDLNHSPFAGVGRGYPTAEAREAERVAEEAVERERLVQEAYERGVEDGRRIGEEAEAARLRSAVAAAERALDEVREGEQRWSGCIEENVCALSVAIARHIMDRELKTDQSVIVELVRRAIKDFPIDQPLRIRINPLDLVAINSLGADEPRLGGERELHWIGDGLIAPGGCVVEGRDRIVDGRVDTAIERLYRRLTYAHV